MRCGAIAFIVCVMCSGLVTADEAAVSVVDDRPELWMFCTDGCYWCTRGKKELLQLESDGQSPVRLVVKYVVPDRFRTKIDRYPTFHWRVQNDLTSNKPVDYFHVGYTNQSDVLDHFQRSRGTKVDEGPRSTAIQSQRISQPSPIYIQQPIIYYQQPVIYYRTQPVYYYWR